LEERTVGESKAAPHQEKPEHNLSFAEHREAFKDVLLEYPKGMRTRIIQVLYNIHIHSLEELAKTPASILLNKRNIGCKSLKCIRTVLENRGFTLGKDWDIDAFDIYKESQSHKSMESLAAIMSHKVKRGEGISGQLLTINEAAKYIRMGLTTLYDCVHSGAIPFYRPPRGKILLDTADLDDWLRISKVPAGRVPGNI
jgi:excisionase family DNA binding protein